MVKDNEQIQLPLPVTKRVSQSAHILSKSRSSAETTSTKALHGIRPTNSAPPRTTISGQKETIRTKGPSTRIFCTKSTLEQFSRHPERFLSTSNRYLPLLRRQATAIESRRRRKCLQSNSRCSDHSEIGFDEVKSFLSDENDLGFVLISLSHHHDIFSSLVNLSFPHMLQVKSISWIHPLTFLRNTH